MKRVPTSKVYRLLYPAVPAVVAASHGGKVSAMPVVSIISLSSNPALVGISSSPLHATYGTILAANCFSVSWLDRRYSETVEKLGKISGAEIEDKLKASGLHYTVKGSPEVPVIREASAYVACALAAVQSTGDHNLIVAEVREARAVDDFDEYWSFEGYHPILYAGMGRRPPLGG